LTTLLLHFCATFTTLCLVHFCYTFCYISSVPKVYQKSVVNVPNKCTKSAPKKQSKCMKKCTKSVSIKLYKKCTKKHSKCTKKVYQKCTKSGRATVLLLEELSILECLWWLVALETKPLVCWCWQVSVRTGHCLPSR